VAGITSEWWPASVRNRGRHQIGIPAGITSEYLAGMRRNLQYAIVEAGSHEAATKMFEGHPHLQIPQSSIEIMAIHPLPGM
jgi:hypothetical protein